MKTVTTFPRRVREIAHAWIPLRDGTRLAARIWLPTDARRDPVPAILEYLPYRKRDGTYVRDALTHPYFAGHGYACVRVDIRGNGDSDGLMDDEYTQQELDDACEVIAWLRAQPWCTGAVGMMGISWGGFNGLQVAAMRPEGLKAVVTLCSTDDRYRDDIHYKGGCLLGENLGWSATMHAYSSRPADPALVGEGWRAQWLQRLEHEPLLAIDWLRHPTRDAYWKHGSVCEDWSAITAAVLAVGGWNDAYSNAVPRLVSHLQAPARGIIGPWAHKYPHFAVPEPRIGFLQEALRWWDHWLKGQDRGVEADPAFRTYIMQLVPPGGSVAQVPGRWVSDSRWPFDRGEVQRWHLNAEGLSRTPGARKKVAHHSPLTIGADGGEYCVIWLGPEFAGDQRYDDAASLCFDSAPLTAEMDLVGAPALTLRFSADQPVAQVAVRLNSVWPDGTVSRLSYATFNLCHRQSHEHPEALVPGKTYTVRIPLDDVALTVPRGHRLRVALSTSYWPMVWPSPQPVTLTVHTAATHIELPVRARRRNEVAPQFAAPEAAAPVRQRVLSEPKHRRELTRDQATGEVQLDIEDDFGRSVISAHGLEVWACGRERYRIHPNDPLSAVQECHWSEERRRGDWHIRTETRSSLRATRTHWVVWGELEAFENGQRVLHREWNENIKRRLQ